MHTKLRSFPLERIEDGHLDAFPIGVTWSMIALRQTDHLVLPISGRRSIYCSWPPASFCEICGAIDSEGYVGPVVGEKAHFPSVRLHYTCNNCARQALGLGPDDLTGHRCVDRCTDRLHMELVDREVIETARPTVPAGLAFPADSAATMAGIPGHLLPPAETDLLECNPTFSELRRRGWQVVDITPAPRPWASANRPLLALWIEPLHPFPWSDSGTRENDPWVW